jgi:hypothetical protein
MHLITISCFAPVRGMWLRGVAPNVLSTITECFYGKKGMVATKKHLPSYSSLVNQTIKVNRKESIKAITSAREIKESRPAILYRKAMRI